MDGEPEESRPSQQGQQQEAGERPDCVGDRGQRSARQEEVGALLAALFVVCFSVAPSQDFQEVLEEVPVIAEEALEIH